jgi:hypothetical protein
VGGLGAGTGLGGTATAKATENGASGSSSSTALSDAASTNPVTDLQASAYGSGAGSNETNAIARFGGVGPDVFNGGAGATIAGSPSASAGAAVLRDYPNIGAAFGSSPTYLGMGELVGSHSSSGSASETSTSEVQLTINEADFASGGTLELGLYDGGGSNPSGLTGVRLTVTGNGSNLLSAPINTTSDFTDFAVNLGTLGTSGTLQLALTLTVTTDAVSADFGANFLLGKTG